MQTRSRSRGGPVESVFWEHEEYDAGGRLVARYESYEEIEPDGARRSGWRKYDIGGRLLFEHRESIPASISAAL